MRRGTRHLVLAIVMAWATLGLGLGSALALEPWALYDDFVGARINPDRWGGGDVAGAVREATRKVSNGKLLMDQRAYGRLGTDVGSQSGLHNLRFMNQTAITAIDATVTVTAYQLTSCPANGDIPFAMAQVFGSFFSTFAIPTPGSSVGDVGATIQVQRHFNSTDGKTILRVAAGVGVSTTPNFSTADWLPWVDLGTVAKGVPVRLRMQWDVDNSRFIFQRDSLALVFIPYAVPYAAPAGNPNKIVAVNSMVPNCATGPRPIGFMRALFDSVSVNASAIP